MTLKKYLIGMAISTLFCWFSWGLILLYIDPYTSGLIGILCFYVSLLFALVGTITLIGFYLRIWISKNEVVYAHIGPSFRQAILLSIILIGSMILQSMNILTWWDGALFILIIGLLEFFFISRTNKNLTKLNARR